MVVKVRIRIWVWLVHNDWKSIQSPNKDSFTNLCMCVYACVCVCVCMRLHLHCVLFIYVIRICKCAVFMGLNRCICVQTSVKSVIDCVEVVCVHVFIITPAEC